MFLIFNKINQVFILGYGHIFPTTKVGKALTIVYAIIGIPLFLLALTDFGKVFTRSIKYLWSFVRRLYYTGSCRTVRKTAHVDVSVFLFVLWFFTSLFDLESWFLR